MFQIKKCEDKHFQLSLWFIIDVALKWRSTNFFEWSGIFAIFALLKNYNCCVDSQYLKITKISHLSFHFGIFDLSGNTVWPQVSGFQKLAKMNHLGIFDQLLSTQNVNVARFARNIECDFFDYFQTLWCITVS